MIAKKPHAARKIILWIIAVFTVTLTTITVVFAFSVKPPEGNPTLNTNNSVLIGETSSAGNYNDAVNSNGTDGNSIPSDRVTANSTSSAFSGVSSLKQPLNKSRNDIIYNFLLAGTDAVAANTDTIIVASFNSTDKTLHVISVPRDTMVQASRANKKINAAYEQGGMPELEKEIQDLLGFSLNRYILVNLKGIEKIIDTIGGIDFDVPRSMNYDDPLQDLHIHLKKGPQHLNGNQVLQLARYRHGYTNGDIGRVLVQQHLIKVLASRVTEPGNILKIPDLVNLISKSFKTDMNAGEMLWLFNSVKDISPDAVGMSIVPGKIKTVDGLSYWLPDKDALAELVRAEIQPDGCPADNNDKLCTQ